jgi:hypothetical protein
LRCDQQIVAAGLVSRSFKSSAQLAINAFNRRFECKYFDRSKDGIDLRSQSIRVALYGAIPKLGRDDNTRANRPIPDFKNSLRSAALWIPDNVRKKCSYRADTALTNESDQLAARQQVQSRRRLVKAS